MRLIWKKYDSKFDPVVALVGLGAFAAGVHGTALLGPAALRHPVVCILAAIPLLLGVIGLVVLIREYQLWRSR